MSTFPVIRCLIFCALMLLGVAPVQAQSPAAISGVMTRWQTTSKTACEQTYNGYADESTCPRSLMFSITPDLTGLTVKNWVDALASAGVNTGVIYVMPGYRLSPRPVIGQMEWADYNEYIYLPPASLSDAQKKVILKVGEAISLRQYTVQQRNYAIAVFLEQLQKAFPASKPVKFILDERIWFINHLNTSGEPVTLSLPAVFALEQDYSTDIAGLVQMAAAQHLDGWLSGVRLSEYASKDWNLMGPVMVDLVTQINAKASGWMKTHLFIGAGGGWGQDWKGVNSMQCPATKGWQFPACTGDFPFFAYMNQQVGYFAFGDKFMEFGKPEEYLLNGKDSGLKYTYINGEVVDFCQENTRNYVCADPAAPTIMDWLKFLDDNIDGLGFSDLVHFLDDNAKAYPRIANVIFEGDNSDSIATMITPASLNGAAAMADLFSNAMQGNFQDLDDGTPLTSTHLGTWTGRIFMDGFDDTSTVPRPGFYGDAGYSVFDTNYNDFTFTPSHPQIITRPTTMGNWTHWP